MKFTATIVLHGLAPSSSGPAIMVSASPVAPGAPISISVSNGPANRGDWVAISAAGSPDGSVLAWGYLSGTHQPPPVGLSAATVVMTAPAEIGNYEARFLLNDIYTVLSRAGFAVGQFVPPPPPPQPEPIITVAPTTPRIPDTTPRGAVIATYSVAMSDGSPFTGSVRFGAPDFDDGGVFALALPVRQPDGSLTGSIVINPSGPGVGPNTVTHTDRITLETTP